MNQNKTNSNPYRNCPPSNHRQWREKKALKVIGNYTLTGNVLGKGQFGEVVLAQINDQAQPIVDGGYDPAKNGPYMACKIIKKANLNDKLQQNLKSEIGILSSIQSPYVIGLYDIQKT